MAEPGELLEKAFEALERARPYLRGIGTVVHDDAEEIDQVIRTLRGYLWPNEPRVVYVWPRVPMEGQDWLWNYAIEGYASITSGPKTEAEAVWQARRYCREYCQCEADIRVFRPGADFEHMSTEQRMEFWRTVRARARRAA